MYEENKIYAKLILNKLSRFSKIIADFTDENMILYENAISSIEDICYDYYKNKGVIYIR